MYKNMSKDARNVNRTRYNTWKKQHLYTSYVKTLDLIVEYMFRLEAYI